MKKSKIITLIVAGGSGTRFGGKRAKQYMALNGKPLLRWSIESFTGHNDIADIQVVIAKGHEQEYKKVVAGLKLPAPVYGGKTRQESVMNGLRAIKKQQPDLVLIHDAARPFVSKKIIDEVISALSKHKAVIPAVPVTDTIKKTAGNKIKTTVDKSGMVRVQTPQGFHYSTILSAHEKNIGGDFTDDASIAEVAGIEVVTIPGSDHNFKITSAEDFTRAEEKIAGARLGNRMSRQPAKKRGEDRSPSEPSARGAASYREDSNPNVGHYIKVGMGFDVHAFAPEKSKNNFIMMCGVKIPYERKLTGHSDADAGLHAIVDAILGTIGQGDIGEHFPPSDKKWKGADSTIFTRHAARLLAENNCSISNLDITIICEEPKITPHKKTMVKKLAEIFEIYTDRINIKATTTEGLGFTGRKEGVAVQAVVTVNKMEK